MISAAPSQTADRAGVAAPQAFAELARLVETHFGIVLSTGKEILVRSRLEPRFRELGIEDLAEYLRVVKSDRAELGEMVDRLTTNKTEFFREQPHFDYLEERVWPTAPLDRPLRIWSAGCSSGEEPYSLAMSWIDRRPAHVPVPAILATDICSVALRQARKGTYDGAELESWGSRLRSHAESANDNSGGASGQFRLQAQVRGMVSLARLNLLSEWPMRGLFDLILCRNVMIYFSRDLQLKLAARFAECLREGGHLLIGHSESLNGHRAPLEFVQPAVYRKRTECAVAPAPVRTREKQE